MRNLGFFDLTLHLGRALIRIIPIILARISRRDKIRNAVIKHKNVRSSFLDDIKTKKKKRKKKEKSQWYEHVRRMDEGRLPREMIK